MFCRCTWEAYSKANLTHLNCFELVNPKAPIQWMFVLPQCCHFFLHSLSQIYKCQWRTEPSIACLFSKSWRFHATSLTCFLLEEKNTSCQGDKTCEITSVMSLPFRKTLITVAKKPATGALNIAPSVLSVPERWIPALGTTARRRNRTYTKHTEVEIFTSSGISSKIRYLSEINDQTLSSFFFCNEFTCNFPKLFKGIKRLYSHHCQRVNLKVIPQSWPGLASKIASWEDHHGKTLGPVIRLNPKQTVRQWCSRRMCSRICQWIDM